MARVNKKRIDEIFGKIYGNFNELDFSQKRELLMHLERKAMLYNGKEISEVKAVGIALEKIKYHFARIYSEGKSVSTLITLKKYIDFVDNEYKELQKYRQGNSGLERIKELITYLEIRLNLDVSFYGSLFNIYEECLYNRNLSFDYIVLSSERRNNR